MIKHFAGELGGKGWWRPDMAQGGGSDVAALPAAFGELPEWVMQPAQLSRCLEAMSCDVESLPL